MSNSFEYVRSPQKTIRYHIFIFEKIVTCENIVLTYIVQQND